MGGPFKLLFDAARDSSSQVLHAARLLASVARLCMYSVSSDWLKFEESHVPCVLCCIAVRIALCCQDDPSHQGCKGPQSKSSQQDLRASFVDVRACLSPDNVYLAQQ